MAKKHIRESMAVMWTFEEGEGDLGWAVFVHVGGAATRLSPWAPSTAELVEALKHITGLAPPEGATSPPIPTKPPTPTDVAPDAPE
jgi:hypothetical protein